MLKSANFSFFRNDKCEFFPCHETARPEDFNCLFCYCPLYALGSACGGNFKFTDAGIKDCSDCMLPHRRENYALVTSRFEEIVALVRKNEAR